MWSPHRFFYYDRNHWTWRDRHHGYNHLEYRRSQHWVDHRKPKPHHDYHQRPHQNTKPHQPSHNVRTTNPTTHHRVNSQPSDQVVHEQPLITEVLVEEREDKLN